METSSERTKTGYHSVRNVTTEDGQSAKMDEGLSFGDFIDKTSNVSITITLRDLSEMASRIAEKVATQLLEGQQDELLTRHEVCDMLGVSSMTLYRWDRLGYLPKVKIGRAVRYKKVDVERISNKHTYGNI